MIAVYQRFDIGPLAIVSLHEASQLSSLILILGSPSSKKLQYAHIQSRFRRTQSSSLETSGNRGGKISPLKCRMSVWNCPKVSYRSK
jgi:hypothetical protein